MITVPRVRLLTFAIVALLECAGVLRAEPMYLAKQYVRCSSCHYSSTGGGLLTPYGRSLTQELSTSGKQAAPADPSATAVTGEPGFLWGALGDRLGPLSLGVDIRPSHLHFSYPGGSSGMNLLMNADVLGAYRTGDWTAYGELGRRPEISGGGIFSYEYWVARQSSSGWGVRAGRFMPAYGVKFADHTDFNRSFLGFDKYDQVLGVEISHSTDHHLMQASISPGRADDLFADSSQGLSRRALMVTGRTQVDLGATTALVASGLYRDKSQGDVRNGAAGLAIGFAPARRVSIWTEGDARFRQTGGSSLVLVNETSIEAVRGVWLKFSPQVWTAADNNGQTRLLFEADVVPRTHFNVDLSFYRDRNTSTKAVTHTSLIQLHLYL